MLAICIKNDWIRYAQADIDNQSFILNQLEQRPLPPELRSCDLRSPELAVQLQKLFQEIIDSRSIPDREVFISLGYDWVDCHLLDVDRRLSVVENETYLKWVFEQRQGILWEDTVVFFQETTNGDDNTTQVLTITAMKNVIESIKIALDNSGTVPVWMEPSVQSIMRVVTKTTDEFTARSMTIEPSGEIFRAQFHTKDQLKAMAEIKLRSGKFSSKFVKGDAAFVDGCLSDLNAFLKNNYLKLNLQVFLIGEFSEKYLKVLRQKNGQQELITIVNPFSGMENSRVELPPVTRGSWFVEIVGLMQRRLG